jgi:hypothetical protein
LSRNESSDSFAAELVSGDLEHVVNDRSEILKPGRACGVAVNGWDLHRPRARIVIGLGQALAGQEKFAEAEPEVIEGFSTLMANRKTLRGDTTLMVREALEAVVQVYRAAGKPEQAAEWEKKRGEL